MIELWKYLQLYIIDSGIGTQTEQKYIETQSSQIETFHSEYLIFATTVEKFQNSQYRNFYVLAKFPIGNDDLEHIYTNILEYAIQNKLYGLTFMLGSGVFFDPGEM